MQLLRAHPGASLVLVEKEAAIAKHQTGHNSGVIHAGVYYDPGSLKAVLCKRGAELTKAFCTEHKIPYEVCGKMLVASNPRQLASLSNLEARARQNGLNVERLEAKALRQREPNITGLGALFVNSTGIVDYRLVADVMAGVIAKAGGEIALGQTIVAIQEHENHVSVSSEALSWKAKKLVVCAGLQSDRLAGMAGLDVDFQIIPFRGEYFRLPSEKNNSINHLIYPVPEAGLPFLGIHLTRMIDGGVTVGPNAVLGFSREGYKKHAFNARDVLEYSLYPGFWKLLGKNLRSGVSEIKNSACKKSYLEQCRQYYPSLRLEDLQPSDAGIRAQAVTKTEGLYMTFCLSKPLECCTCNAPSPAATSAIPIAEMIVAKLEGSVV
ncbi:L-2-hydroxyglutarate oxidase [Pseudomonas syringae pv. maculicola]|nr:L-2-hydroxyglutarate oxidase [Pseudomonas syringae pv. maculicola]